MGSGEEEVLTGVGCCDGDELVHRSSPPVCILHLPQILPRHQPCENPREVERAERLHRWGDVLAQSSRHLAYASARRRSARVASAAHVWARLTSHAVPQEDDSALCKVSRVLLDQLLDVLLGHNDHVRHLQEPRFEIQPHLILGWYLIWGSEFRLRYRASANGGVVDGKRHSSLDILQKRAETLPCLGRVPKTRKYQDDGLG